MKTLTLYHHSLTVDRDGELEVKVEPSVILESFTASEILEHFDGKKLLDLIDDDDMITHLEAREYSVVDLVNK